MYGNNRNMGGGGRRPQPQFSPVREGEEIDVKIEAVGEKGDGIAKKNGFVIFVPGVQEGDEVRIRVTRVLKKVGFAEVLGKAQGPIAAPTERKQQAPIKAPEPEEHHEDSEDFGEESQEEDFDESEDDLAEDDLDEDSEDEFEEEEK